MQLPKGSQKACFDCLSGVPLCRLESIPSRIELKSLLEIESRMLIVCLSGVLTELYYISGDRALDYKHKSKTWRI